MRSPRSSQQRMGICTTPAEHGHPYPKRHPDVKVEMRHPVPNQEMRYLHRRAAVTEMKEYDTSGLIWQRVSFGYAA